MTVTLKGQAQATPREFQGVASVGKALAILAFVGGAEGYPSADQSRTFTEIADHTGLPKSTLMRLLSTLIDYGFLIRTKHGNYRVSLTLWRIGCAAVAYDNVRDDIEPVMRELTATTRETSLYAVYEDGFSVYVEKVDGLHPIRAYTSVGGRSPAYASATGKAQLAWQDEDEIERVARTAQQLTPATHHTVRAITSEMQRVRDLGYAVNRGEWAIDVWGIAAPVFTRNNTVVGAIGVSGPRHRIENKVKAFAATVLEAAATLSSRNGASRPMIGTASL